jgi:hypothetical protein
MAKYYRLLFRSVNEHVLQNHPEDATSVAVCRKEKLTECVQYFRDCQEQELAEKRDWDTDDPLEFDFEPGFTMPEWL